MSVEIPKMAIALGPYGIAQGDVIEARVHLGATKEVSSWELLLQNWDNKYSPGGTYPLAVGQDGYINIGRGTNVPQIITTRTESVKYESGPNESYVRVAGRCWGEKLFRRVVTKTYSNQKGEAIVKDLLDYFSGISHNRSGQELVEDTDTTYTKLEYSDSPVWDILKYIAESADKVGVIGFDFRVAPDGKFEFFAKNSKTSPVSLSEKIEISEYRKDIHRVRNKIMIYGIADKSIPINKVEWTRSLTPSDGDWAAASGSVSVDPTGAPDGGACIKLSVAGSLYYGSAFFTLHIDKAVNAEIYPLLNMQLKLDDTYSGTGVLNLWDATSKVASKNISISPDEAWHIFEIGVGSAYANQWESIQAGFDWTTIRVVKLSFWFPENVGAGDFRVHALYFGGRRYSAVRETSPPPNPSDLRELSETDEELWSDNECDLRAKALLAYLKDPAEYLTISSTVIDYGTTPLLPGDKIHVTLPNENVDADFRIESVEYKVDAKTQTLEITLELGKVPPQMADYLYGLRTFTVNVEKLSRTKMGRRGVPVTTPGGGAGGGSYFNSNVEVDKIAPVVNLLTGRVLKACIGFDGVNFFVASYTGDLILRAQSAIIRPYADGSDDLGSASFRFNHLFLKGKLNMGGSDVITAAKILQNVTADAGIITSGEININRMPRDTAGLILEAQGAGFYPMYVNPNGRYAPAAHESGHGNLYPAGGSATGYCGSTSNYWNCIAGNSIWYKALGQFDALDDLALIKRIRSNGKTDEKGIPLADLKSLPIEVTENGLINAGNLMGLLIGAVKQLAAKVEFLEKQLKKAVEKT